MRIQKFHRDQFSIFDGVELFGFTNPLVQRLFHELVANENGTANQNIEDIHLNGDTLQSETADYNNRRINKKETLRA